MTSNDSFSRERRFTDGCYTPPQFARKEPALSYTLQEWLNIALRWTHVFAGIMWVGTTYYFTWLDARLTEEEKAAANTGNAAQVWMVHSGGFYLVEKQKAPSIMPGKLHWFRWEAALTWLTGLLLFMMVYYEGKLLVEFDSSRITQGQAMVTDPGTGPITPSNMKPVQPGDNGVVKP